MPLHFAAKRNALDVATLLVENGASLNATCKVCTTSLNNLYLRLYNDPYFFEFSVTTYSIECAVLYKDYLVNVGLYSGL